MKNYNDQWISSDDVTRGVRKPNSYLIYLEIMVNYWDLEDQENEVRKSRTALKREGDRN